jgi:hypothetical protein
VKLIRRKYISISEVISLSYNITFRGLDNIFSVKCKKGFVKKYIFKYIKISKMLE